MPLRGGKGSTLEGGMREPTVVRWPGHIPAGQDNDELMTAMDLLPTFAKLAGAEMPSDRVIDGKDVSAVLMDHQKSPHEAFYYHRGNELEAVRSGKWKLHLGGKNVGLFDLETDIAERHNVIDQHPEVAKRLTQLATAFTKDLSENIRPAAIVENPKPLTMEKK